MIDLENCNYITSVGCIASIDEIILLILLISEVMILHKWCGHNDLDSDIIIGITKTGYTNENIALE